MVQATVRWVSGMQFAAATGSGHAVVTDGGPEYDGDETGPRPLELALVALAGCTGVALMTILKRQRQPVAGLEVGVRAERADEWPRALVALHLDYRVAGPGLNTDAVARAIHLSESRYCSVAASLKAPITSSFQIIDTVAVERDAPPP